MKQSDFEEPKIKFNTIPEAIKAIKRGEMIIVVDDEDRENEGDLTLAADKVTPEAITFMATHGRGLICLPMEEKRLDELNLPLMVEENTSCFETAFTISIDAQKHTTTGISAADRATTIKAAIDPETKPEDLARPGHIFPLRAKKGGVLNRAGQTEAAVDLARMAGCYPAGVICEIMKDDGTMARVPDLIKFTKKHGLKMIMVKDLIKYRMKNEKLFTCTSEFSFPTKYGNFSAYAYKSLVDNTAHIALVLGKWEKDDDVLVRVHSSCLTGDALGSLRCDCGDQLHTAMEMIREAGRGVLLYMSQEGRGIGILHKLRAYELQDQGKDTVEANEALGFKADLREYGIGAQILADLKIKNILLMTNNPKKIIGLEGYGLRVTKRIPLKINPSENNIRYLKTKQEKMGHLLEL